MKFLLIPILLLAIAVPSAFAEIYITSPPDGAMIDGNDPDLKIISMGQVSNQSEGNTITLHWYYDDGELAYMAMLPLTNGMYSNEFDDMLFVEDMSKSGTITQTLSYGNYTQESSFYYQHYQETEEAYPEDDDLVCEPTVIYKDRIIEKIIEVPSEPEQIYHDVIIEKEIKVPSTEVIYKENPINTELEAKIQQLESQIANQTQQIKDLQETKEKQYAIIMEQIKVIYDWVVNQ